MLKDDQAHVYTFERNLNQPIFPDCSPIHWTNSTVLFDGQQAPEQPDSYISIFLLSSGVILARIGEHWVTWGCGVLEPMVLISNLRNISLPINPLYISSASFIKNLLCVKNCPGGWGYKSDLIGQKP